MASTVVTGGSRGLGLEIVRSLAQQNRKVIALSRQPSAELKWLINTSNGLVEFKHCDLSETDTIDQIVRNIISEHGPIEALVNNAAIGIDGVLTTLKPDDIRRTIDVNLLAPILIARAFGKHMLTQGRGRIVNVSSVNAFTGYSGLSVYAATKAGLIGFTKSLARELGRAGVTVNAVAPGLLETDLSASLDDKARDTIKRRSPLGRFATVGEVANTVLFLLSEKATGMTGSVITVDAGNSA